MKLILQIPSYNEQDTLPTTLAGLPRSVSGFDSVEWLVVDDGSSDRTGDVALAGGVDHLVRLPRNQGLARAFVAGLNASLERGADVIVNLDADNQYRAEDIPALVAPILEGRAEIVVGARPIESIAHFSLLKKLLQRLGSWVVRKASRTDVPDAPSGFRAMTRSAARQLHVFSDYTYTLETIIQAGQKGMAVAAVPVRVNPPTRSSRLIRSVPQYLRRSLGTMIRIFMTYRPFEFFAWPGAVALLFGLALGGRFLYHFLVGEGRGHIQSVILAALLLGTGFFLVVCGLLADLMAVNRKLLEGIDLRVRDLEGRGQEAREGEGATADRRARSTRPA